MPSEFFQIWVFTKPQNKFTLIFCITRFCKISVKISCVTRRFEVKSFEAILKQIVDLSDRII